MDKKGQSIRRSLARWRQRPGSNIRTVRRPLSRVIRGQRRFYFSFSGTDGTLPSGRLLLDASARSMEQRTEGARARQAPCSTRSPAAPVSLGPRPFCTVFRRRGWKQSAAGVVMNKQGRLFGTAQHGGNGGPETAVVSCLRSIRQPNRAAHGPRRPLCFWRPEAFHPPTPDVENGKLYGLQIRVAFSEPDVFVVSLRLKQSPRHTVQRARSSDASPMFIYDSAIPFAYFANEWPCVIDDRRCALRESRNIQSVTSGAKHPIRRNRLARQTAVTAKSVSFRCL